MGRSNVWMILFSLIAVFGLLAGCGSDENPAEPGALYNPPAPGSGLGLLAVQLEAHGGPLDPEWHRGTHEHGDHTEISSLSITFDTIRVYPSCECPDSSGWYKTDPCHREGHEEERHGEGQGGGEYFELLTDPVTVDVMRLGPALTALLGTMELPTGDYTHVVLHIVEAWVVTLDGQEVPVGLPDDQGVFVPVPIRFAIRDGEVTEIVIVHDLTRSVREDPPGSGSFFLVPFMEGHHRHGDHEHDEGDHGDGGDGGAGSHDREGGGHGQM